MRPAVPLARSFRRRAKIIARLEAGTLEGRPPSVITRRPGDERPSWHIGPGDGGQCRACGEPIGELEYQKSWPGFPIVVHSGCAEAWRDEGERLGIALSEPDPPPLVDNGRKGQRRCASCGHRLRRDTVFDNGLPYHEICAALRDLDIDQSEMH